MEERKAKFKINDKVILKETGRIHKVVHVQPIYEMNDDSTGIVLMTYRYTIKYFQRGGGGFVSVVEEKLAEIRSKKISKLLKHL